MANYTGEQRVYYNIRRQLQTSIKSFEKVGMAPPPAFYSSRVRRILETTPAKASKGLISAAKIVKNQIAFSPERFSAKAYMKKEEEVLRRISAPPEEGGLGFTEVNEGNKEIFFQFMEYVRNKYENMRFDSDVFAAAANEMLGQAKRRGVTAAELGQHFERFAEQAIRITGSNRTLVNYQQNFNRLARRLGL